MISCFDIQVGTSCNLNCKHCLMVNNLDNSSVDYDKINQTLSNYPKIEEIHLSGGEPLLGDLDKLEKFINKYPNTQFSMTTNLIYKLTDQRLRIIKRMNRISSSFDPGIRFNNFKELNIWYHNLKKIKQINPNILVFICLTNYLISNIKPSRLVNLFRYVLKSNFITIPLMRYGNIKNNLDLIPDRTEAIKWIKKLLLLNSPYDLTKYLIKNKNFSNCQYGDSMICINYNGDIINCILNPDCKNKLDTKCAKCNYFGNCGGSCPYIDCYYISRKDEKL